MPNACTPELPAATASSSIPSHGVRKETTTRRAAGVVIVVTTTKNLRARMRAWLQRASPAAVPRLEPEERRILLEAMAAGGRCSISDLELRAMVHAASVVLDLQRRGLVRADIRFAQGATSEPDVIQVELIDEGHNEMEADAKADDAP
jgi:hypothetical protein